MHKENVLIILYADTDSFIVSSIKIKNTSFIEFKIFLLTWKRMLTESLLFVIYW